MSVYETSVYELSDYRQYFDVVNTMYFTIFSTNCPLYEMSIIRNVHCTKCPYTKCPYTKCPYTNCPITDKVI